MVYKKFIPFFCLLLTFYVQKACAQNYGLRFLGQDVTVLDNRTSLDLSPDGPMCFKGDLDLSFKINFMANSKAYFGYVLRIIDDQSHNIDLMIYDQEATKEKSFRIIIGEKFSNIQFKLDSNQLFNEWSTFRLHFDKANDNLVFYINNKAVAQKKAGIKQMGCVKMLFGANLYNKFKTTDLPAMRIKDIRITDEGKPAYYWPLNEGRGNIATDEIKQAKAQIVNPVWVKAMHYNWEQTQSFTVSGNASVAFNPKTEQLYVVGITGLSSYNVRNNQLQTITYQNGNIALLQGNQAVYDTVSGKLYDLNIDRTRVAAFDFGTKKWDIKFNENERITQFWHANKFISDVDGGLYVLGGYGELRYKNLVQKFDFNSKEWKKQPADSNTYGPRYLAALGAEQHTGNAYIIGGYGSLSGSQMLNPRNYYDLVKFNVKDGSFKPIYKFKYPDNDFAFANSLIIDSKNSEFYGLIFPNQKFNSTLQLIRGSLNKADYQLVGNKIPYQFYDIRSFADLYYCPTSKKLLAVTLYRKTDTQTEVKIYTIGFPPNMLAPAVITSTNTAPKKMWYVLAAIVLVVLIAGLWWFKNKKANNKILAPARAVVEESIAPTVVPRPVSAPQIVNIGEEQVLQQKSAIYLFGNLQVFDAESNNISRLFTPLLKELFLLILIYSIRRKTGVSSEKLNEILWFDKSKKDALNNRSVNIAKLKTILEKIGPCQLSKTTGYWKIEIDYSQVIVDYQQYLDIVNTKQVLDKQKIESLFVLIQRGSILLDTDYEWLDEFKTEVTNEIIDRLLLFARSVDMAADPEILIQTTNHIFHFDPVNEDAMQIQCKVLASLGKHSVSKHVYEKFVKEYKSIYNEDYDRSFHSIIE